MEDREVLERLQGFLEQRRQVQLMEKTLQELTPAERIILERMVIRPRKNAERELCQLLEMERATVYRYRRQALEKVKKALGGGEDA